MVILLMLFSVMTGCLEIRTWVDSSVTVPLEFPEMDIFQIELDLVNSSKKEARSACRTGRRFLDYKEQGDKFVLDHAPSPQFESNPQVNSSSSNQKISNFIVTREQEIYVITSKGRILSTNTHDSHKSKYLEVVVSKQQAKQLGENKWILTDATSGILLTSEKIMYLLINHKLSKIDNKINNISRVQYLSITPRVIKVLALSSNTLYSLVIDIPSKKASADNNLLVESLKNKQGLKEIRDFAVDDSVRLLYVLDSEKGLFSLSYSNIQSPEFENVNHLVPIQNCYRITYLSNYLIATCGSKGKDYITEIYYSYEKLGYVSRTPSDQEETTIYSVDLVPGYYILSKHEAIEFYHTANRLNQNQTHHLSINEVPIDPLIKTQLFKDPNSHLPSLYSSSNHTISKISLNHIPPSVTCQPELKVTQTFKVTYKGICDNGIPCIKQSAFTITSSQYKYLFLLFDLFVIFSIIGIKFHLNKKKQKIYSGLDTSDRLEFQMK